MRTRRALTLLTLLPLVALAACSSSTSTNGATTGTTGGGSGTTVDTSPTALLPGSTWSLDSFATPTSGSIPARPAAEAVLSFGTEGELNGSTGCNRFSGTYQASGTSLTIELGPMTKVACAGPLLEAQETAITTRLPQVASFAIEDLSLRLLDAQGSTLLTYGAGLSDLAGTAWGVLGVNNGAGAVATTALTEKLTLSFEEDGSFAANGGCNSLGGSWATSGTDELTITLGPSTMMACPEDVMQLEAQFTAALGAVTTYELVGSDLTLRDATGAAQVTARLAGESGAPTTTAPGDTAPSTTAP